MGSEGDDAAIQILSWLKIESIAHIQYKNSNQNHTCHQEI